MSEEITTKEEYWNNGNLQSRINYKNGKRYGLCESWFGNENLESRENFKDEKQHGLCESWYENGNLYYRYNYKDGKQHGLCEYWFEDGTLISRVYYFNNELVTEEEFNKLSNPQKNNEEYCDGFCIFYFCKRNRRNNLEEILRQEEIKTKVLWNNLQIYKDYLDKNNEEKIL